MPRRAKSIKSKKPAKSRGSVTQSVNVYVNKSSRSKAAPKSASPVIQPIQPLISTPVNTPVADYNKIYGERLLNIDDQLKELKNRKQLDESRISDIISNIRVANKAEPKITTVAPQTSILKDATYSAGSVAKDLLYSVGSIAKDLGYATGSVAKDIAYASARPAVAASKSVLSAAAEAPKSIYKSIYDRSIGLFTSDEEPYIDHQFNYSDFNTVPADISIDSYRLPDYNIPKDDSDISIAVAEFKGSEDTTPLAAAAAANFPINKLSDINAAYANGQYRDIITYLRNLNPRPAESTLRRHITSDIATQLAADAGFQKPRSVSHFFDMLFASS